jgi:hypothetical protein
LRSTTSMLYIFSKEKPKNKAPLCKYFEEWRIWKETMQSLRCSYVFMIDLRYWRLRKIIGFVKCEFPVTYFFGFGDEPWEC